MVSITVSEEKLSKVLADVEALIEDVTSLVSQDAVAKKRLSEIMENPSIGKSEAELDKYLKERGVKVDRLDG